ncbi:methyltransferase family protein [Mesorhizobium marinum]|uniref:Isoprenylcysteine carboxylmethyltransferase family protein n=1 Tax=Mesorhizobium marinum TaxID=3228790 RepID=A0ABV3QZ55_9HYPH
MTDDALTTNLRSYQRLRRLTLAALLALVFFVLLFGQSVFPPETVVHEAIEMSGIVLIVIGIAGRLWSTLYIGGRKAAAVVTDGPYSITRNPLYVFSSVAAMGVGAQMGSITVAIGFGLACAAAFHVVILREERFLTTKLGAEYTDYIATVPRFLPNPALYREGDATGFKPQLLLTTLIDGLVFLVAMPLFEIIDAAQLSGTLPVLFRVP